MTFLQYLVLFIIIYICLYSLLSRLCQCIEHCATAKSFAKLQEAKVAGKSSVNDEEEKEEIIEKED